MLRTRPHPAWLLGRMPRFLVLAFGNGVVSTIAACTASAVLGDRINTAVGFAVLVAWLLAVPGVYLVMLMMAWLATQYVITDRRVFAVEGVILRRSFTIPLPEITKLSVTQTAVDELFRSGDLLIESEGRRGASVLHRLPQVHMLHSRLMDLLTMSKQGRPTEHAT